MGKHLPAAKLLDHYAEGHHRFHAHLARHGQTVNSHFVASQRRYEAFLAHLRCQFGYFHPTGGYGEGVPWAGHYNFVYPTDPNYFDKRDGQVYGAQGSGVPMTVPLAPNVDYTYNYGWGTPSSRLTPISTVVPFHP